MLPKSIRIISALALALTLASCATMSPEECRFANWTDVGMRDGLAGKTLGLLNERISDCAEAGVLGVLPGVIGLLQATEAIKLLLGVGTPLTGRLLQFDALAMRFRETRLAPDPDCAVCAPGRAFPGYIDYAAFCAGG